MKKSSWEYRISINFSELQQLGREGWELVSVTGTGKKLDGDSHSSGDTFYLKRPCPSIREEITAEQRDRVLAERREME